MTVFCVTVHSLNGIDVVCIKRKRALWPNLTRIEERERERTPSLAEFNGPHSSTKTFSLKIKLEVCVCVWPGLKIK